MLVVAPVPLVTTIAEEPEELVTLLIDNADPDCDATNTAGYCSYGAVSDDPQGLSTSKCENRLTKADCKKSPYYDSNQKILCIWQNR